MFKACNLWMLEMNKTFECVPVDIKLQKGVTLRLDIPFNLYSHIKPLAESAGKSVAGYIESIVSNKKNNPVCWKQFDLRAEALLMIYEFCFRDSECSFIALQNIRKHA